MAEVTLTERILLDPGHRQAYQPPFGDQEPEPIAEEQSRLANLHKGQRVKPRRVVVQHQAPRRGISEGALVKLLQQNGVGRPSTYAQVVASLVKRGYARRDDQGELVPTARGREVCAFLTGAYPQLFTPAFTATMEQRLDAVAAGTASYRETLEAVWQQLQNELTDDKEAT